MSIDFFLIICDREKKLENLKLFKANKSQRGAIVSAIVSINKELYA